MWRRSWDENQMYPSRVGCSDFLPDDGSDSGNGDDDGGDDGFDDGDGNGDASCNSCLACTFNHLSQ